MIDLRENPRTTDLGPLLRPASRGDTVLVCGPAHAQLVRGAARHLGRRDLKIVIREPERLDLRECYFVVHRPGPRAEVHILDEAGRAVVVLEAAPGQPLRHGDRIVPAAVMDAALRQRENKGDYVTAEGQSVDPINGRVRDAA